MYLVYRALENEPVPMSLPPPLIPPSKRKKVNSPSVMPLLPSPPSLKERSSTHSGSQTLPAKPTPPQVSSHIITYSFNTIEELKQGDVTIQQIILVPHSSKVPVSNYCLGEVLFLK